MKKRILILHMQVGNGHLIPALAIKEAINSLYPDEYDIGVYDFAKEAGANWTDKTIKKGWDFLLNHPNITNQMYKLVLDSNSIIGMTYPKIFLRDFLSKGPKFIKNYEPDIIISTYFFCTFVAMMAKEKQYINKDVKIIQFIADSFTAHIWWTLKVPDYSIVSSTETKNKLLELGVDKDKIVMFPFPLRASFENITKSKEEIKKNYNIDDKKKIMLVSPGGSGISNIPEFIKMAYKNNMPYNILNVCGRNDQLKEELEQLIKKRNSNTNLIPLGYVENMNELLYIADFVVAKPGTSTTMESLIMNKPVIFTQWIGYQEKPNLDFIVQNKLGWYTKNRGEFLLLLEVIYQSNLLDVYTQKIKSWNFKSGSKEIAEFIVKEMNG